MYGKGTRETGWRGVLILVPLNHVGDLLSLTSSVAQARYQHVMLQVFIQTLYFRLQPSTARSHVFRADLCCELVLWLRIPEQSGQYLSWRQDPVATSYFDRPNTWMQYVIVFTFKESKVRYLLCFTMRLISE
jgi:hypothetical protein